MVKTTALTMIVALITLPMHVNAQDKKPATTAAPGTPVLPADAAAAAAPDTAAAPGVFDAAGLKKQLVFQRAQIKKLIEEYGADSAEVKNALQVLKQMEIFGRQALTTAVPEGFDPANALLAPGGVSNARMMQQYLQAMMKSGGLDSVQGFGSADPRQTAVQGLEFELKTLAAEIQGTKDQAVKEDKTEELREIAETVVVLRTRYRQKAIKQLEKKLAALKAEAEDDSVDSLLARVLSTDKKPTDKKPSDKKPSDKPKDKE